MALLKNTSLVLSLGFLMGTMVQAAEFSSPGPDKQIYAICQQCMDPKLAGLNPNCAPISSGFMQEQMRTPGSGAILPGGMGHSGNPFQQMAPGLPQMGAGAAPNQPTQ